jgi:hypothetical protein
MPSGWVHRTLRSGRALVLVDGVDEVPESDRGEARRWLEDLAATFPDAIYVVTSRPAAAEQDWLAAADFEYCALEPMTPQDIEQLIDHWHSAVAATAHDQEARDELIERNASMKNSVRDTPSLRSLATSPLLCAMLCALNRERRSQIPKDRMELYRIALEMLLGRRDVERKVPADLGFADEVPDREKRLLLLLQDFAFWLMLNDYTDASVSDVIACFNRRLATLQRVQNVRPEVVFRYFLERSGLIREPIAGRVDFVHRTFQEYLAASEAIDQDNIGLLLSKAEHDQWREVVILAAGHANMASAERLLSGLIDRGIREPEQRHKLHLLAVACLETAADYSDELGERLRDCLIELLPPRNMTEAQAVASAGELAIAHLRQFTSALASSAAACVRALTLIGGDRSLDALSAFGDDRRVTVARELIRSWSYFDAEAFASRVLANSVLDGGFLQIKSLPQLKGAAALRNLTHLWCFVRDLDSVSDLIAVIGNLHTLSLGAAHIEELDVTTAQHLTTLSVTRCPKLTSVELGNALVTLAAMKLSSLQIEELDVAGANRLVELSITNCARLATLESIRALPLLSEISLDCVGIDDLSPLASLPSLSSIHVVECPKIESVEALYGLRDKSISLDYCYRDPSSMPVEFLSSNLVRWVVRLAPEDPTEVFKIPEFERAKWKLTYSYSYPDDMTDAPWNEGRYLFAFRATVPEDEMDQFLAVVGNALAR